MSNLFGDFINRRRDEPDKLVGAKFVDGAQRPSTGAFARTRGFARSARQFLDDIKKRAKADAALADKQGIFRNLFEFTGETAKSLGRLGTEIASGVAQTAIESGAKDARAGRFDVRGKRLPLDTEFDLEKRQETIDSIERFEKFVTQNKLKRDKTKFGGNIFGDVASELLAFGVAPAKVGSLARGSKALGGSGKSIGRQVAAEATTDIALTQAQLKGEDVSEGEKALMSLLSFAGAKAGVSAADEVASAGRAATREAKEFSQEVADSLAEQEGIITQRRAAALAGGEVPDSSVGKSSGDLPDEDALTPGQQLDDIDTTSQSKQRKSTIPEDQPKLETERLRKDIEQIEAQKGRLTPRDVSEQILSSEKRVSDLIEGVNLGSTRAVNRAVQSTSKSGTKLSKSRDLRDEAIKLIKKKGEKVDDVNIKKFMEEELGKKESIDLFIARKRGIISDELANEVASGMKVSEESILALPKGAALNKEQLTAMRQVLENRRAIHSGLINMKEGDLRVVDSQSRDLLKRFGDEFPNLSDSELLHRATEESAIKLKQLEIITLAAGSEAGRALQSLKAVVKKVDPRMRAVFRSLRKKSELERQAVLELLERTNIDDPKKFISLLDELHKPTFLEKFVEWATAVKLYNPTTHVVNITSNTARQIFDATVTAATNPKALPYEAMGTLVGANMGLRNMVKALTDEGYAEQLSKFIEAGGRTPAIKGKTGEVVRLSFRALSAADEFFKAIAFQRFLYRDAFEKATEKGLKGPDRDGFIKALVESPDLDTIDGANKFAKRMTFQEDLGKWSKKVAEVGRVEDYDSLAAQSASAAFKIFVPFFKTPLNITKQALGDLSPLALFTKNKKLITKEGRRDMAELVLGTSLMAWMSSLALDGLATGAAPADQAERNLFYAQGKQPYSIKYNNKWIPYGRMDPFATIMGAAVDLTNRHEQSGQIDAVDIINVVLRQLKDKTFLQGIDMAMDMFSSNEWERDNAIKRMVTGFIPNIGGAVARSIDPVVRDTKGSGGLIEQSINSFKAVTPGLSKTLPARIDPLGKPITRAASGFNKLLNPFAASQEINNPVVNHLVDIDYAIPSPKNFFTRDGERIDIPPDEFEKYSMKVGMELERAIRNVMKEGYYQDFTDEEKADEIKSLRKDIQAAAKDEFAEYRSIEFDIGEFRRGDRGLLEEKLGVYNRLTPSGKKKLLQGFQSQGYPQDLLIDVFSTNNPEVQERRRLMEERNSKSAAIDAFAESLA